MTEARDALAVALERSDAAHVHRLDPCPACTLIADAILAALPDGWVLARRQDAEDGAARGLLRAARSELDTVHHLIREWARNEDPYTDEGDALADYITAHDEAARKAREALP